MGAIEDLLGARYDLSLWTTMDLASNITSDETLEGVLEVLPELHSVLETMFSEPQIRKVSVPFVKMLKRYWRDILDAHNEGKKIAWINFNFPPALLHAMDIVPFTAESLAMFQTIIYPGGCARAIDYCTEIGLPETMCTAQRGGVGAMLGGYTEKPDMVLNAASGSCDTNSANFAFVSEYLHLPFCNLDAPPYYDDDGPMRDYYRAEFRKLVSFLEEQTGNKLDEDKLRAVCEEVKKQDEYIAELYDLRRAIPNPFPGIFHLILFSERFVGTGTPEATEMLKAMYEVTRERYKSGQGVLPEEKVRLYLCYLGHYTTGGEFWTWLENNGISPIMEMLSMFNHQHYRMDCSNMDTMLDSLADQSSNTPMTKQIRGPYDYQGQWLDDAVTLVNDYKADCAIYLGTMGCKNTWGCVKVLMRRIEEDLGIPTLIIQSDAWDDRVTPWPVIKDQIEEFVNTVVL